MSLEELTLYLEGKTRSDLEDNTDRWRALRHFPARRGCLLGAIHGLTQWSQSIMNEREGRRPGGRESFHRENSGTHRPDSAELQ